MQPRIDLNADIGEGFGFDLELMSLVSSVNVCTGFHAGSLTLAKATAAAAKGHGCRVGAHIGFPDRASLGRSLPVEVPDEWVESVLDQVVMAADYDYIKPHGALYHWLAIQPGKTSKVWDALAIVEKPFMGMRGTEHESECRKRGLTFVSEGFCERAYTPHGLLIPRSEPGAVLTDIHEIEAQALQLASRVDSICIHGDRPDCVKVVEAVRRVLFGRGFEVAA